MEHLAVLQLATGMIEGQHKVTRANFLDGLRAFAGFDTGVLYETLICDEHLEFAFGVFGDVVRRRPTTTDELEERRIAGTFAPDEMSLFITCQSS
jgi:hypothetical protein